VEEKGKKETGEREEADKNDGDIVEERAGVAFQRGAEAVDIRYITQ